MAGAVLAFSLENRGAAALEVELSREGRLGARQLRVRSLLLSPLHGPASLAQGVPDPSAASGLSRETEEEGKTFHRTERSYGSFRRALTLPADADETAISAHMKNGVLEIAIAKAAEMPKSAKRIDVKSGL